MGKFKDWTEPISKEGSEDFIYSFCNTEGSTEQSNLINGFQQGGKGILGTIILSNINKIVPSLKRINIGLEYRAVKSFLFYFFKLKHTVQKLLLKNNNNHSFENLYRTENPDKQTD